MMIAAALLLLAFPQDEKVTFEVKDGHTQGILYGFSTFTAGGSPARRLWALRPDGVLLHCNPEGSFEDFLKRDLTAEEKKSAGRYEIDGTKFKFTYPKGEASVGDAIFDAPGRLARVTAAATFFYAIRSGIDFPLTGYYSTSSSFTSADGKMSTTAFTNFSFFPGGFFATESGASTFCRVMETKSRESSRSVNGGVEYTTETFQQEATKFYGGDAKSKVGKFEVKGSSLVLRYDDGTVKNCFLAQIGTSKKPPVLIVINSSLYDGTPGKFSEAAGGAAPAPPPVPALAPGVKVSAAGMEFELPEKWTTKEFDQEGAKTAALLPPGVEFDAEKNGFLFAFTTDKSEFKSAFDAVVLEKLTGQIQALAPGLQKQGDVEKLKADGQPAILLTYSAKGVDGATVLLQAYAVVKEGREAALLILGPEPVVRPHLAALRRAFETLRLK